VELSKPALQGLDGPSKDSARHTLLTVLDTTLRLLHPLMPFVTEEIWQNLPGKVGSICIAPYPIAEEALLDADAESGMALVIGSITALRGLRAEFTPGGQENESARAAMLVRRLTVTIVPESEKAGATLREQLPSLVSLARLGIVTFEDSAPTDGKYVSTSVAGTAYYISADELLVGLDYAKEEARLQGELVKLEKELSAIQGRLNNPGFLQKAAPEAVEKAQLDARELLERRAKLEARRELLAPNPFRGVIA
jgi:valyl-tRNA synthetase